MEENALTNILEKLIQRRVSPVEASMMNPLNLAYIGDAVYEIYIRTHMVLNYSGKINDINKKCVGFVKASAQSKAVSGIIGELTESELKIVKRGRNASPKTVPKNAKIIDYKMATGFEALLGYLYLTGDCKRLEHIIIRSIEEIEKIN